MRKYSSISLGLGTSVLLLFKNFEIARFLRQFGTGPSILVANSISSSSTKSGVPRPVTYATQSQSTKHQSIVTGQTGSHPGTAVNPSVPHPGLLPFVMSVKPKRPWPYNQGLRKPSGAFPSVIKKSLRSAIMPATTCTLTISWMDDTEWGDGRKTHRCRRACAIRRTWRPIDDDYVVDRLRRDVGNPAASRAAKAYNIRVSWVRQRQKRTCTSPYIGRQYYRRSEAHTLSGRGGVENSWKSRLQRAQPRFRGSNPSCRRRR